MQQTILENKRKALISNIIAVHGNKFTFEETTYEPYQMKIAVACRTHGVFTIGIRQLLTGTGCPVCTKNARVKAEFEKARLLVKTRPGLHVALNKLETGHFEIELTCKTHGHVKTWAGGFTPIWHCRKCGNKKIGNALRGSTDTFVEKAKEVHGDTYSYATVDYKGATTKVQIVCAEHGAFNQTPTNHLSGTGCPACAINRRRAYSAIAIQWIELEGKRRGLRNIRHAENGGEYTIPGTNLRADGFHKPTNTIFEFHGDRWHGNLDVFKPNAKPNHWRPTVTTRKLHAETIGREQTIRDLGYNLVVMWESDFRKSIRS